MRSFLFVISYRPYSDPYTKVGHNKLSCRCLLSRVLFYHLNKYKYHTYLLTSLQLLYVLFPYTVERNETLTFSKLRES